MLQVPRIKIKTYDKEEKIAIYGSPNGVRTCTRTLEKYVMIKFD